MLYTMGMRWLVLAVLAGCAHFDVSAQPSTIAKHAAELQAGGYARIEVEQGGTVTVASDDHVVITIPGNERSHLWGLIKTGTPDEIQQITIGNLVAGCGADGLGPDCVAARARGSVKVGQHRKIDPAMLAVGLFGAVATGISTTCLAICSNRSGWAYVGTGIASVVMLVPLSTVF